MRASIATKLLAVSVILLGAARPALASLPFPEAVKEAIPSLDCVPQCTLCHQTNPGMVPANKPFAFKLKQASVVLPQQPDTVKAALAKLKELGAMSDADADGTGDYTELEAGTDPNSADAAAALCGLGPTYGCGATLARTPAKHGLDPAATVAASLFVLVGLLLLRRSSVNR
jgi:hypothetical protein